MKIQLILMTEFFGTHLILHSKSVPHFPCPTPRPALNHSYLTRVCQGLTCSPWWQWQGEGMHTPFCCVSQPTHWCFNHSLHPASSFNCFTHYHGNITPTKFLLQIILYDIITVHTCHSVYVKTHRMHSTTSKTMWFMEFMDLLILSH